MKISVTPWCAFVLLGIFCQGNSTLPAAEQKTAKTEEKKTVKKEEKKEAPKEEKDPLAKYSEEDLLDPGKACQKFFEAIAAKDAAVVKAFIAEVPANLAKLDLQKEADRETLLKAFATYQGANVVSSIRMAAAGIAQITYSDANGKEKTLRMQNAGGRWKWVGD